MKRMLSWNVNGIRAARRKGFLDWFAGEQIDILCLQETKAHPEQLDKALLQVEGFSSYFASAEKKGYSGVAVYTREKPVEVHQGLGIPEFDREGRTLILEYSDFVLFNIYYPNGKQNAERLDYKMRFYEAFQTKATEMKSAGKNLIICGDVNTAHKEIDLAHPKSNEKTSGFLPMERDWIDRFLADGFVDTFRIFNQDGGHYSWWDMRTRARDRDIGWRIDYFFVSGSLEKNVKEAFILKDVMGSDHCPIGITVDI